MRGTTTKHSWYGNLIYFCTLSFIWNYFTFLDRLGTLYIPNSLESNGYIKNGSLYLYSLPAMNSISPSIRKFSTKTTKFPILMQESLFKGLTMIPSIDNTLNWCTSPLVDSGTGPSLCSNLYAVCEQSSGLEFTWSISDNLRITWVRALRGLLTIFLSCPKKFSNEKHEMRSKLPCSLTWLRWTRSCML